MSIPRALAMKRLKEKEELAKQAALLGQNKNKGIMSNLGSIGQFIADDNNDLDNLSFSTVDGLNATFKNNRAKDTTPKYNVGSTNIQPVFPNFEGVTSDDLANPDKVINFKPASTALTSFIEENSAAPKESPRVTAMNKLRDQAELDALIEENKKLQRFRGDSSRIAPAGTVMQPRWDGSVDQNLNYNMPVEGQESAREAAIRSGISQEQLDDIMLYSGNEDPAFDENYVYNMGVTDDGIFPDLPKLGDEDASFDENYVYNMGVTDDGTFPDLLSPQPLDGSNELEIGPETFKLPEDYEALDEVMAELELSNPDLANENAKFWEEENKEQAELDAESERIDNLNLLNTEEDTVLPVDNESFDPSLGGDIDANPLDNTIEGKIIQEEKDNREAYIQLSNTMAPEDLTALDKEINEIKSTADVDGQEVTESKLSDLFGSLKDIFGVDNKSLLRAAIKYIGGRVFGMSSGKAAQFAWAGIEADMATEAAKGADAKAYQANMDEYDKMYESAMSRGDFEEADRILQKMNSLSGIEKSDAEKFDDNLTYLNKKYNQAKKIGDKTKMSQIAKQLKKMQAAGIDGTKADTWMGSAGMYDKNGTYVVKQAMQVDGEGIKIYDESDNTFKLPSELGYRDAIRTPSSDKGNDTYAVDARVITDPAEFGRYSTEIPNAIGVSAKGVPQFDEGSGDLNKAASFSHTAVKSFMQMEDILAHSDAVRQEIFSLQSEFRKSIADMPSDSAMKGLLGKFIKRDMSPAAKLWFNEMNTLVTSKLRRETGAAYNKEELVTTMNFFPNVTDYPANFDELDAQGKINALNFIDVRMKQAGNWILTNAQGLQAYEYLEGLKGGLFRPDDEWLDANKGIMEFLDAQYNPQVSTSTQALIEQ